MTDVALLGLPYDAQSSFMRGPADGPATVRRALASTSANGCAESGRDVLALEGERWVDLGDAEISDDAPEIALAEIRAAVADARTNDTRVLAIGGDHIITWPLVEAIRPTVDRLTILHFDAHPDLYDELDGNRYSHACPFARIMENELADRLVQVGIRTMTPHQREQADRFGVESIPLGGWDGTLPDLHGAVHITVDIDALDPAFAPGISHHEPGGMSTRQLIDTLHQLRGMDIDIVSADLVEVNPTRDINDMTAMVGAKLTRELLDLLLPRQ